MNFIILLMLSAFFSLTSYYVAQDGQLGRFCPSLEVLDYRVPVLPRFTATSSVTDCLPVVVPTRFFEESNGDVAPCLVKLEHLEIRLTDVASAHSMLQAARARDRLPHNSAILCSSSSGSLAPFCKCYTAPSAIF